MNEIIRSLWERKSVRVFTAEPIAPEDTELILRSACEAPTAGNQQMYSILNITDPELKRQLSVSCDNQPFIATAPLVLIFCADMVKWHDAFRCVGSEPRPLRASDLLLAAEDAMIAAQNAVTAAESLGIGSCYIGDILEQAELHREMLHLPEQVVPVGMVVFGYPGPGQAEREKPPRHALEDIVMENAYVRRDEAALRRMFSVKADGKDLDEWMRAFCTRKFNSAFSREMARSVEVYLRSFRQE